MVKKRKSPASGSRLAPDDSVRAALREQLRALLTWQDAHVGFERAVEGVPSRSRGVKPSALPYSLWQLLEHIRLAQRDILEFCVDAQYRARKWPDDYWPESPAPPTAQAWRQSVAAVRADRKALIALLDGSVDLFAAIPHGQGQTYLRELVLVADHNAFHVGQLVLVRRLLGVWHES
jgi:hypothetical protein